MSSARPVQLQVGVIGTGRVGSALAVAFANAGHQLAAVSAVSQQSRRRAERLGVPILAPDEVVAVADLVLVTVPDDALRALVAGLAATGAWRSGQMVAHTSGAHGIGILDPAAARGVIPLALHPVMTFTGRPEDVDRLAGATFGVTTLDELRAVAEALVVDIGAEPVWLPEPVRPLYHAALTLGANYLVTLVNDAVEMLGEAEVENPARLIAPLLSASLDNALRLGDAALTGPVSRGDTATIATHLQTLHRRAPQAVAEYQAMGRRTAERALAAGRLTQQQLADVLEALR